MIKKIVILTILALITMLFCSSASAQIALVVNKDNPVSDLSMKELKRIYLGKHTSFPDGVAIKLGVLIDLRESFYKEVLGMPLFKVRRHWIKTIFAGGLGHPPKPLEKAAEVKLFVEKNRRAIAFIDLADVDDKVKVIMIDGKRPGQEGYPLN